MAQSAKAIGAALLLGILLMLATTAFCQPLSSDREVIERLVQVEEGQKQLAQGIEQLGERLTRVEEGQRQLGERLGQLGEQQARLEERQGSLEQRVEAGFAVVGQRIDELREFLLWGFGVTFAGMFALVGFVIWDRRTALAPAVRRIEELEQREQRLEAALREFAAKSPELADSLRKMGLL